MNNYDIFKECNIFEISVPIIYDFEQTYTYLTLLLNNQSNVYPFLNPIYDRKFYYIIRNTYNTNSFFMYLSKKVRGFCKYLDLILYYLPKKYDCHELSIGLMHYHVYMNYSDYSRLFLPIQITMKSINFDFEIYNNLLIDVYMYILIIIKSTFNMYPITYHYNWNDKLYNTFDRFDPSFQMNKYIIDITSKYKIDPGEVLCYF